MARDRDTDDSDDDDNASIASSQESCDSRDSCEFCADTDDDADCVDLAEMDLDGLVTVKNSSQSPLLRLPAEIRLKIYTMALNWESIHIMCNGKDTVGIRTLPCKQPNVDNELVKEIRGSTPPLAAVHTMQARHVCCLEHHQCLTCAAVQVHKSLTLLLTCRQVYLEAALLPFELQTFTVHTVQTFNDLMHNLTITQAQSIKSLVVVDPDLLEFKRHTTQKLGVLNKLTLFVEVFNIRDPTPSSYKVGLYNTSGYLDFESGAWTCLRAHQARCIITIEGNEGSIFEDMLCFAPRVAKAIEKRVEDKIRIEHNTLYKYFARVR